MKLNRRKIIGWGAISVVAVIGVVVWTRGARAPKGAEIRTAEVMKGSITASVSGTGTLQAWSVVEVKSNVGGQVVELAVDEGDVVATGQLIARIDPSDTLTSLAQAQADMAGADARIAQARQSKAMTALQTTASIRAAEEAVEVARLRLRQAEEQARLQPQLTQSAIEQAQSAVDVARASFDQTSRALVPQKVATAQANYDQALAAFGQAKLQITRLKALAVKGFVAQSQVDSADQQYASARAALDTAERKRDTITAETAEDLRVAEAKVKQAEASLASAKANRAQDTLKQHDVTSARASLKQAQANLASAKAGAYQAQIKDEEVTQARASAQRSKASLDNARTQVGYTTILAPSNGVVVKKYVEPGSIVVAGRSSFSGTGAGVALVELADITRMVVTVNVDETDIGQIVEGQRVKISVDAYPTVPVFGTVAAIAPKAVVEQNITSVPVRIEINAPNPRLKPGMNATCEFIIATKEDTLLVPAEAVTETRRGMVVKVLQDGKPVERRVKVGIEGVTETEILQGLKPGDSVVTAIIDEQKPQQGGNPMRPGGNRGPRGGRPF